MSDKIRFRDADFRPTVFFKPTDQMGVCLPAEEFRRYAEIALRHRPNFTELIEFLKDQKHEMEIHKWIESEKVGHDLGNEAIKDWIDKYADEFRQNWNREHGQSK